MQSCITQNGISWTRWFNKLFVYLLFVNVSVGNDGTGNPSPAHIEK